MQFLHLAVAQYHDTRPQEHFHDDDVDDDVDLDDEDYDEVTTEDTRYYNSNNDDDNEYDRYHDTGTLRHQS